jgi:hypothetical protein
LQELRRVEGASGENHLTSRRHAPDHRRLIGIEQRIGSIRVAAVEILDTDRPVVLVEQHTTRERPGANREVVLVLRLHAEQPFARADPPALKRGQRRQPDAFEPAGHRAPIIRIEQGLQPRLHALERARQPEERPPR